jgi:K+-sensing histidine kinase KdpD
MSIYQEKLNHPKEYSDELLKLFQRFEAIKTVYEISISRFSSFEEICDKVVINLSKLIKVPCVAVQHTEEGKIKIISRIIDGKIFHNESFSIEDFSYNFLSNNDFKTYIEIPIKRKTGNIAGSICCADFTERTFTEEEMEIVDIFVRHISYEIERDIIELKPRESDKIKILGQISAGLAHQIRNPLNAILVITEAFFQEVGNEPKYKPYLEHIKTQVDRLSRLMGNLIEP